VSTQAQRTSSRSGWRNNAPRLATLIVLLGLALLLSAHLVDSDGPLTANLLFQSPPTDTPDPNSSLPTPTFTHTPSPTSPTTPTGTTLPSSTPSATSTLFPTATLFATDTLSAPDFVTDTPAPTWTPYPEQAPPSADLQPPFESPLQPPTPTPVLGVAPPAAVPTVAVQASPTLTTSAEIVLLVRPLDGQPAAAEADSARPLDTALFIDNMVIAAGYVWTCFGVLALIAGVVGGVLLLRRSHRTRQSPPGAVQPAPAPQSTASPPPRSTLTPADQRNAAASPATRFAARHRSAELDDLDRSDA
jgi:hypothetical protein